MPDGAIPRNHAAPAPVYFDPIGSFSVPDYPDITLRYPPVLKIIEHCYSKGYTLLHAATPGPMGLVALFAATMLKIPIHATYHTAFPEYMLRLTNDPGMEKMMWRYICWYYKQMDAIFVPSEATAKSLEAKGFPRERMHLYPRGIDADRYTSAREAKTIRMHPFAKEIFTFLYVGRISKEKSLDLLVDAFAMVCSRMERARLLVTGGGPLLEEMRGRARNLPVTFTGFLQGNSLLQAYGQGDIFVFPSVTDTFGNVVLEAQAAGLAVIVSAQGGPRENIVEGRTGIVVEEQTASCYAEAMLQLAGNPDRLLRMQREAVRYAQSRSHHRAFAEQWQLYREVCSA
jgi:glycosyltransferase involved in cell wall biosynthesis